MTTPEGRVKTRLKKALDINFGADCWRFMPVPGGYGKPAHDFILCFRGHFVSVETKAPDGELSALQKETRREILQAGGLVFCVYDYHTIGELIAALRPLEFLYGHDDRRAETPLQAKDPRERKKHLQAEQQDQASAKAVGRDNGAPTEQPERRPVKGAGGDD